MTSLTTLAGFANEWMRHGGPLGNDEKFAGVSAEATSTGVRLKRVPRHLDTSAPDYQDKFRTLYRKADIDVSMMALDLGNAAAVYAKLIEDITFAVWQWDLKLPVVVVGKWRRWSRAA